MKLKKTHFPFLISIHVELCEKKDQATIFMVHNIVTNLINYVQGNVNEQISKLHRNKPTRRTTN